MRGNPGFNEAAGIPRGRRAAAPHQAAARRASMRPRVFPAEDGQWTKMIDAMIELQ